jgi:hypothetical protein
VAGFLLDRRNALRGLGWLVLLSGLALAAGLYVRAPEPSGDASGYEVIDGVAYPRRLEDTKQYARQMEAYGGKGLILADAVLRFLDSLLRGRRLAVVVAAGSVLAALVFFQAASPRAPEEGGEDDPDDAGGGEGP